jgi:hypothetical protein
MTPRQTTSRPRQARRVAAARRGITLLEVILAVLLLALTVAAVTGAISAILGMEAEGRKRLEAYEICNRIMLQFLDDEDGLPGKSLPITYGDHKYFWDLDKTPARMVINKKQESGGANLQALDRFMLVGVTVYDANENGNYDTKGEPIAFLSRVIDPYAPRNPDSLDTFGNNPDKITKMIQGLLGGGAGPNLSGAKLQGRQLK